MLTITPRASSYIESTGINPIRFGVKPNKGCAGFEYIWQQGEIEPNDYRININDKFTILVARNHKKYVDDCQVDLKDIDDGTGYKICFDNKKTQHICGCGESLDFAPSIRDSGTWQETWTIRTFDENFVWDKNSTNKETGEPESVLEFDTRAKIESDIKLAGDSVRDVRGNNAVKHYRAGQLSDKYKNWRK